MHKSRLKDAGQADVGMSGVPVYTNVDQILSSWMHQREVSCKTDNANPIVHGNKMIIC